MSKNAHALRAQSLPALCPTPYPEGPMPRNHVAMAILGLWFFRQENEGENDEVLPSGS